MREISFKVYKRVSVRKSTGAFLAERENLLCKMIYFNNHKSGGVCTPLVHNDLNPRLALRTLEYGSCNWLFFFNINYLFIDQTLVMFNL